MQQTKTWFGTFEWEGRTMEEVYRYRVGFNFLIFPCMQKRVQYTDAKCAQKKQI